MKLRDSLKSAFKGIKGNLLRSVLTALGIIIGVAAVISLLAVGYGAREDIFGEVDQLGTNVIMVFPRRDTRLTVGDAGHLAERVPTVIRAAALLSTSAEVRWGTESYRTTTEGVSSGYDIIGNIEICSGRYFTEKEAGERAQVAVVGSTVVRELFGGTDPVGERISIYNRPFTVIGVMQERGAAMGQDHDDLVLTPIGSLQRAARSDRVSRIHAQAEGPEVADLAAAHIQRVFVSLTGRDDAVNVISQEQILQLVASITGIFTIMLTAIAGISLLVGGIGIMNIMLVSVKERTREIGIRKAVGARQRDILLQFLLESTVLSVSGGVLGILAGWVLTRIIVLFNLTVVITPQAVLLAVGFSAAVGLFFGVYPAMQAARLDPIQALRYE